MLPSLTDQVLTYVDLEPVPVVRVEKNKVLGPAFPEIGSLIRVHQVPAIQSLN